MPDEPDGLVLIRTVYLSFVSALIAIAVVIAAILGIRPGGETSEGEGAASALVMLVGVLCILGSRVIGNRPLDCRSEQALAESFRKSFFLSIALAELVALSPAGRTTSGAPGARSRSATP